MALSYNNYTATSGQTEFAFSFPYLSLDHVKVKINGVDTAAYTVVTSPSTKVVLNSGATAGASVKVYRKTPGRSASPDNVNLVDFVNGSVLSEEDLDKSNKQLLYLVQESDDTGSGALGPTFDDTAWDATNLQIKNLGQPTAGTDAATKGYVDGLSLYGSAVVTPQVWTFTTAAQTNYTLSPPALTTDPNMFILDIGGVPQRPTTNFTITNNGATLSLVATPAAGVSACLRNFGATRNVQSYAAPVTFNAATTTNANATVNGTLTATNLTSVGHASLDGIWVSNANSDSTSIYVGEQGAAQTGSNRGNTAVGKLALNSTTIGPVNAAFGYAAMQQNTTGDANTAIGSSALASSSNLSGNSAVGYGALQSITSGGGLNAALGAYAGAFITGGSVAATNLSQGVFLGNRAYPKQNASTNEIVIGSNAVGEGSNTSTIGNSSTTDAKIYGTLTTTGNLNVQGIGTTTIAGPVSATGNVTVGGTLTASGNTWPQAVQTLYTSRTTYATANAANTAVNKIGGANMACHMFDMDCTITPRSASSKVKIEFDFHSETNQQWDTGFILVRRIGTTRTQLGVPVDAGKLCVTAIENSYPDQNVDSTMQAHKISFLDSPNTTSPVVYELHWTNVGATSQTISLNGTWSNAAGHERTSSRTILTEYFA